MISFETGVPGSKKVARHQERVNQAHYRLNMLSQVCADPLIVATHFTETSTGLWRANSIGWRYRTQLEVNPNLPGDFVLDHAVGYDTDFRVTATSGEFKVIRTHNRRIGPVQEEWDERDLLSNLVGATSNTKLFVAAGRLGRRYVHSLLDH